MGTCSRLATILDADMLDMNGIGSKSVAQGGSNTIKGIAPPGIPDSALIDKQGKEVHVEIGKRYLLRYLLDFQVNYFAIGNEDARNEFLDKAHYVTPTPLSPKETVPWLALPAPDQPRRYVLLINPNGICNIRGPRWVRMGLGIEYIIPASNLHIAHIVDIGPVSATPSKWPLLVT